MTTRKSILAIAAVLVCGFFGWYFWELSYSPGFAIVASLDRLASAQGSDADGQAVRALIQSLRQNYVETRADATCWSGVFWGASFFGLLASALGALVLKLESWKLTDAQRKDWGAVLAGAAALAVSICAAGDFKQKWQANRLAAAALESSGYKLLAERSPSVGGYYERIAEIQLARTTAITGKEFPDKPASAASGPTNSSNSSKTVEPPAGPSSPLR